MRKRSCNAAGTMDSRNTWKYYKASCNNKINWGWQHEWQVYVVIQRDLSVIWNCNGEGHKGFGETLESIFEIFWSSKRSSGLKGLSERKWVRDPNVRLSKMFNRNRRKIRVPEYRRGIKDPNTTQWRRGPVSHTVKLVKVFHWQDSTSAKELERGLPTSSRLWYQLVTPPIQSYTNHAGKCVRSRSRTHGKISQHNSRHKLK